MSKLISIIIPVYNHASILKTSINAILLQTYRPVEIIIVNDGSTDNFEESINSIVESVEKKDIKIQVFNQENQGAPVARNRGFDESKGDYVIFWDADTTAKPQMLEKMVNVLEKNQDKSFVYSDFKFGWKKFKSFKFNLEKLKKVNYISMLTLIKRDDFPRFDESLKRFQDWDLWLQMASQGKTGAYIPEILYQHLVVGGRTPMSSWLPKFFYKLPIKNKSIKKYQNAKEIIYKKHNIYKNII